MTDDSQPDPDDSQPDPAAGGQSSGADDQAATSAGAASVTAASTEAADQAQELEQLRAENDALKAQMAAQPAERPRGAGQGWRRRWISVTCAVLAAIVLPLSIFVVWARDTMLDTDQYVETVSPLAEDEVIQDRVSTEVSKAVSEAAEFEEFAKEVLPAEIDALAVPIALGAEQLVAEITSQIVSSDAFATLWEEANRAAHALVVPLLTGEGGDLVDTADGEISVDLASVVQPVVDGLEERLGSDTFESLNLGEIETELSLFMSEDLASAQDTMSLLDTLSWLIPLINIVLLIGAVVFAPKRRLGFRRTGVAIVVANVVALLMFAILRSRFLSQSADEELASAVFDTLTRFVLQSFRVALVTGLFVLLLVWLFGPSPRAARVRSWWDSLVGRVRGPDEDSDIGEVAMWVTRNERALQIGTVVVAAVVLALWTRPTGMVALLIALVALLVIGVVSLVAQIGSRATPDGELDEANEPPDDAAAEEERTPEPV